MCNVEGLYNQQIDEDPLKVALRKDFYNEKQRFACKVAPSPVLVGK
jgi:hypothetical protein